MDPEEQRLIAAYQREQEAMLAPAGVHASGAPANENSSLHSPASSLRAVQPGASDLSQIAALNRVLTARRDSEMPADGSARSVASDREDDQTCRLVKKHFCHRRATAKQTITFDLRERLRYPDTKSGRAGRSRPCLSRV